MKLQSLGVALVFLTVLVLPVLAAADEYPTEGCFHMDFRWASLINLKSATVTNDDEDIEQDKALADMEFGLGRSAAAMKIGYLIKGSHDVGGHFLLDWTSEGEVIKPEEGDDITAGDATMTLLLAPYYNYNFHVNGWLMPYVGPLVGIEMIQSAIVTDDGENEDIVTTAWTSAPFIGVEGGLKMFPYEHVAFDIGLLGYYGIFGEKTSFELDSADENPEDSEWSGGVIDIGIHGGLNIYF